MSGLIVLKTMILLGGQYDRNRGSVSPEYPDQAIIKSKHADEQDCFGLIFYYIAIHLYYQIGERAIYSSQRLAHEILYRVYGHFRDDPNIALLTFSQELKYVAKKINHNNLLVDSCIFQLYEKYIIKRSVDVSIKDVLEIFRSIDFIELDQELVSLKSEIQINDANKINSTITDLISKRKLILNEQLSIEELNILTNLLDLIERYLESSKKFGKHNLEYVEFLNQKIDNLSSILNSIEHFPDYLTSRDYYEFGGKCELSNPALALENISKAISKNPTIGLYYFNRGALYSKHGQNEKALHDFLSAENVNPDYANDIMFQTSFGTLYKRLNEYEKAIQKFDIVIELNPEDQVSPRFFKTEILLRTNQYSTAIEQFKELISLLPDEGHLYYSISYCYLKLEQYKNSLIYIEKTIALNYYLPESIFIKSYCLLELKKIQKASHLLSKFLLQNKNELILYPLIIKCNKLERKNKLYHENLNKAYILKIIEIENNRIIPIPISPGHIEMKRFGKTYHKEDFLLSQDYFP